MFYVNWPELESPLIEPKKAKVECGPVKLQVGLASNLDVVTGASYEPYIISKDKYSQWFSAATSTCQFDLIYDIYEDATCQKPVDTSVALIKDTQIQIFR